MSKLKIGMLPVTNRIVIGSVSRGLWGANRTDVTEQAVGLTADFLYATKQEMFFKAADGKNYKLAVVEISE